MNFIRKLQQKSRSTRLLVLWLATFLVMMIIVFIWLFSFSQTFQPERTEKEIETAGIPSLFESIEKDFSIFKQRLEASLENIYGEEE